MIENLLTIAEEEGEDPTLWSAVQNCVVSRSGERYLNQPAAIKLEPVVPSGPDMIVELARTFSIVPNTAYRCFAFFCGYCTAGAVATVSPKMYNATGDLISDFIITSATGNISSTSYSASKTVQFNTWTLVAIQFISPANASSANLQLRIESNRTAFFDQVGFVQWQREAAGSTPAEEINNRFGTRVLKNIPEYMREEDKIHSSPDRHLERFIDLFTFEANNILTSSSNFNYVPASDGVPGFQRSTIVDPDYYFQRFIAESAWLPWLAQLVGVSAVSSSSGGTLTPWFFLEENYPDWSAWQEDIDPVTNPVFAITEVGRSSNFVTATINQTSGDVYDPKIGDGVEITSTTNFDGAFVVTSIGSGKITWYDPGSDGGVEYSGTVVFSDASWTEVESLNPNAFDGGSVLLHLTRTGATGINAGSRKSMIAAARAVLSGLDSKATVSRIGNVLTVTSEEAHGLVPSDQFAIYLCDSKTINSESLVVASVVSPYTITANQNGYDVIETSCRLTNRRVEIVDGASIWEVSLNTLPSQTYASGIVQALVGAAKPAGMVVTYGSIT